MESLGSVHDSRVYLIPAWMNCQFPRFEQSEWDLSNTLQTLTHGVTCWNPRDGSLESCNGRRHSWCIIKITEFHLHNAQTARTSGLWVLHKIYIYMICFVQIEAWENGWLSSATISLLVLVRVPVMEKLSTATSIAVSSLITLGRKAQEKKKYKYLSKVFWEGMQIPSFWRSHCKCMSAFQILFRKLQLSMQIK